MQAIMIFLFAKFHSFQEKSPGEVDSKMSSQLTRTTSDNQSPVSQVSVSEMFNQQASRAKAKRLQLIMYIKNNMDLEGGYEKSLLTMESIEKFAKGEDANRQESLIFDQRVFKKKTANTKRKKLRADSLGSESSVDSDLSNDAFVNQLGC